MTVGPRDIVMALPVGNLPRAGKVRTGVKKDHQKADGDLIQLPSAVDYFVVNHDSVTNRSSAEGFARVFGPTPRELPIVLPAPTVDEVFAGAWRRYRAGELLERKCTGPGGVCVVRGPEGEWISGPCQCERDGLDPEKDKEPKKGKPAHCAKRWTLNFLLMDVPGLGIWQWDTGSIMSAEGIAETLTMVAQFRGHLQGMECSMRLVPRKAHPGGKSKTVYIVELGAGDMTPAQALAIAAAPTRVALPPSSLDELPDPLLDHESSQIVDATPAAPVSPAESPAVSATTAEGQTVASTQMSSDQGDGENHVNAGSATSTDASAGGQSAAAGGLLIDSIDAAKQVIRGLDGEQRSKLLRLLGFDGPAQLQQVAARLNARRGGELVADVLAELPS